jgi:hypothetical protein
VKVRAAFALAALAACSSNPGEEAARAQRALRSTEAEVVLLDEMQQLGHLPSHYSNAHRRYLQQTLTELQKKLAKLR